MANELAMKNEYVFITFNDVLRTYAPTVLKILKGESYRKEMSSFIDYDKFDNLSDEELNFFCLKRTHRNILDEVAKRRFDTALTLTDILYKHNNLIIENGCNLSMANSMALLAQQKFTKKMYIYSEFKDDVKIVSEVFGKFANCYFVSGDFTSAIKSIKEDITLYVLDDADRVYDLINLDKAKYTDILIANYGFNYTYDKEQQIPVLKLTDENLFKKANTFRLNMFMPFSKEQLRENKDKN